MVDSKRDEGVSSVARSRVTRRIWAISSLASALSMEFSQFLVKRRQRPSHAKVRSTTHLRGSTFKPLTAQTRGDIKNSRSAATSRSDRMPRTADWILSERPTGCIGLRNQVAIDLGQQALIAPAAETVAHGRDPRKVLQQERPCALGGCKILDRIPYLEQLHLARTPKAVATGKQWAHDFLFRIGQIAWIALRLAPILRAGEFGPGDRDLRFVL